MIKSLIITTLVVVITNYSAIAADNNIQTRSNEARQFAQTRSNEARQFAQTRSSEARQIAQTRSSEARQIAQARPSEARQPEANSLDVSQTAENINDGSNRQRPDDDTRLLRRAEMQLKRMADELNLTDEQLEKAKELFVDYEKQQNALRAKINELNTEKMEKFEELLTDEQKKIRSESRNNRTLRQAPVGLEERRQMRLDANPNATEAESAK